MTPNNYKLWIEEEFWIMNESYYGGDEAEEFLSEISLSVLKENLLQQFRDPGWISVDYFDNFVKSFEYSMGEVEDEDDVAELNRLKMNFFEFMTDLFRARLGIGFPNFLDTSDDDDAIDLMHFTYRFFTLNIKENFLYYIWNFIDKYKEDLSERFEAKKDITFLAYRKKLRDLDIMLISNLAAIINYILEADITIDEFFELCEGDESGVELMTVVDGYNDTAITGNFIPKYAKMIGPALRIEIEQIIRSNILRKYRTQGLEPEEDEKSEDNEETTTE